MGEPVIQLFDSYSVYTCCVCGITVVMTASRARQLHNDHSISFYCLNGHAQHFTGEPEAAKLRRENESLQTRLKWKQAEAERIERRRRAAQAQATKARNKLAKVVEHVGNGVCPCCRRTFQNLMRHMQTKHPEYRSSEAGES